MSRRLTRPPPPPPTATAWWALEALREQGLKLREPEMIAYLTRATGVKWRWADVRRLVPMAYKANQLTGRSPLARLDRRRR